MYKRQEYNRALHYLTPAGDWRPRAYTCSAVSGEGIEALWQVIGRFRQRATESGAFEARRRAQARDWLRALVDEGIRAAFYDRPVVRAALAEVEAAVMDGTLPATTAAQQLLALLEE